MTDIDVLIVGGGAQGLWLLNDLDEREYKTVLLERHELGGKQTCHSHALIHRGHYYDNIDMMIILNSSAQFWEAFIDSHGISKLNQEKAIAGFGPGTAVGLHTYFWSTAGLRFNPLPTLPEILKGGRAKHLFETEEFSLDAQQIVEGLARDVEHCIYKIDDDDGALDFHLDGQRIEGVTMVVNGKRHDLHPKVTVICAGENNLALLRKMGAHRIPGNPDVLVQARRKSHMLMIRGKNLPPLTAVFPIRGGLQGVFICSRTDPDTGKTVLLASDHNSTPFNAGLGSNGDLDPRPSSSWINRMLISLRATAPNVFREHVKNELELAVYTGLTSERNFGAGKHMTDCFIEPLDFENVLTIWPTKLTLTPFASNVAVRFIRPKVSEPSGKWSQLESELPGPPPPVSVEMWRREPFTGQTAAKTEWLNYADFLGGWDLAGVA